MSLGLGLGLGISGGSGPRPDFDWIANAAFGGALTEAARSGLVAGFASPASRAQYWLNGVSYPSFLAIPGASNSRIGNRAGSDAAVIYVENLIRSSDNLQAGGWNVADGGAITGANSATLTTNLLSRIQAGTITTPAGTTTTVSVELAGSGTVEIHNKDGSGAFGRNVLTVVLTPTLTRYSVTRTSVDFNTILAINGLGTAVTNLTIRNAQCVIGNVAGEYVPNPSTTQSASQLRVGQAYRVNEARNSVAAGGTVGVIGSGGSFPTGWSRTPSGLAIEIVSIVGEALRIRFSGTPNADFVDVGHLTALATASPGQFWTASRYARLVAGTLPAAANNAFDTTIHRFNVGGAYSGESSSFTNFSGSTFVRGTHTAPALPAGTAFVSTNWRVYVNNGVPCDFTVEIASPQLELGSSATGYIPNPNLTTGQARTGQGVRFNHARNTSFAGAVAGVIGSGGQAPTENLVFITQFGLSTEIVGVFTVSGQTVLRMRVFGTPTGTSGSLLFAPVTYPNAPAGTQTTVVSAQMCARLVAGSLASLTAFRMRVDAVNSSDIRTQLGPIVDMSGLNSTLTRYVSENVTLGGGATTAKYSALIEFGWVNGVPVDFTIDIGSAQLERSLVATEFIPNPSTTQAASAPGPSSLRVHGAGTNLMPASEDFANVVWGKTAVNVTSNAQTAPNGSLTADNVVEDTTTNIHRLTANFTAQTAGQAAAISVFVRAVGSARRLFVNYLSGGNAAALFDLGGAGSVIATGGSAPNLAASIVALGNGWFRCTVIGTTVAAITQAFLQINRTSSTIATDDTYLGDGASGFSFWGAFLELNSFASDYIPNPNTGASSSAGADDVLLNLVTAGIDVNRPMTLIYRYVNEGNAQANSAEATLFQDAAPSTNRISSRSSPASQALYTRSGVGVSPSFNAPNPATGSIVTVAVSVSASQIALARTGNVAVSSLAVGGSPLALDRLGIGKTEGASLYSNTGIQAVALIPRALSDAELLAVVA